MELYLSDPQKSSDLLPADYRINFGLSLSTVFEGIKQGMTAHLRIYDAAIRLGCCGLLMTAAELSDEMTECGIPLSRAQAQRVLKDERLFTFVCERKTGKRGRQAKCYRMVSTKDVCASLGFPFGAVTYAPKLLPVDFSSGLNYTHAIVGRALDVRREDCRAAQVETWEVCKQTIIRWTQEISQIFPQILYRRSDDECFQMYPDPQTREDVFLWQVSDAAKTKSRKFWLEIVNDAGEIRKLPCTVDNASRWLSKSVVTLCQQQPNYYRVHAAYRDPHMLLPY